MPRLDKSQADKGRKRKLAANADESSQNREIQERAASSKNGTLTRPAKKRRSDAHCNGEDEELNTSKPSAVFQPVKGRNWTLSIALPGSFINNVIKPDQKTLLVSRIARAAAVFCVDEIVIYDDDPSGIPTYIDRRYCGRNKTKSEILDSIEENDQPWQNPDQFLYHLLMYAECPPYLRMDRDPGLTLFPMHNNLRWAGQMPSMDMPHHLKSHEWCRYREGVTIGPAAPPIAPLQSSQRSKRTLVADRTARQPDWTYVKCGLPYPVKIPISLDAAQRVTLKFANPSPPSNWPNLSQSECEALEIEPVAPSIPREEEGFYWGFSVRRASCLTEMYTESEFENGYDLTIGTSERGVPLSSILPVKLLPRSHKKHKPTDIGILPEKCKHLLVVFGGVAGIEPAVVSDPYLREQGLTKETANEAGFDAWVNLVPGQGSRTIRTEEAVEFGLMGLKGYVDSLYD